MKKIYLFVVILLIGLSTSCYWPKPLVDDRSPNRNIYYDISKGITSWEGHHIDQLLAYWGSPDKITYVENLQLTEYIWEELLNIQEDPYCESSYEYDSQTLTYTFDTCNSSVYRCSIAIFADKNGTIGEINSDNIISCGDIRVINETKRAAPQLK
jgi:hypothetical protein